MKWGDRSYPEVMEQATAPISRLSDDELTGLVNTAITAWERAEDQALGDSRGYRWAFNFLADQPARLLIAREGDGRLSEIGIILGHELSALNARATLEALISRLADIP